jgi:predicted RNA methylase
MSYENPVSQQSMALDDYRNSFYEQALRSVVTPESIVLDVGSGLGVLGLIAATLGAKKVYLVEPATNLELARQISRENKLEDKIEFIPTTIERARLPEQD